MITLKRSLIFVITATLLASCSGSSTDGTPEPKPEFTIEISVADRTGYIDLMFGLEDKETVDNESAPPTPPEGALHAYFEKDESKWLTDFRNSSNEEYDWSLFYQKGQYEPLLLTWEVLSESNADGEFILKNGSGGSEINMREQNQLEIVPESEGTILIEYRD